MARVLITGGAGFIGSHLGEALIAEGHSVRILDNFDAQIHPGGRPPHWLPSNAQSIIRGDVTSASAVASAVHGTDAVYHLAAQTGVGQSQYQPARYTAVNVAGTANLLQAVIDLGRPVRIILSSSRAVYGEGKYGCPSCKDTYVPAPRSSEQLARKEWVPTCPNCGQPGHPLPTGEDSALRPTSLYGISKVQQETLCQWAGQTYGIPVVILRYFNVYGSRQALSNPYTGVLGAFYTRLRSGQDLEIFEDGRSVRDFVHVQDVVHASLLALTTEAATPVVYNVGSGQALSIMDVARALQNILGTEATSTVMEKARVGDIRCGVADLSRSRQRLGYTPTVPFSEGLAEFVTWAQTQEARDLTNRAQRELEAKGLLV